MINVTKTYLPPIEEYSDYLNKIWESGWITNNGQFVQRLEKELKEFLGVKHLFFCTNGTIVLQMAIKALEITKEVITTPFSYVATTDSILWENCKPVFVDINENDFCMNADLIEQAITPNTEAIMATYVYGFPCDIEKINSVAKAHGLKVIYDGAHAFGVKYAGQSLLNSGDISTCSFHATKIFHTVEGGAIITSDDELARKLYLYRQFGHVYDDYYSIGVNAKNSEFHAAMGLCILPKVTALIDSRRESHQLYDSLLSKEKIKKPSPRKEAELNYAYYPVVFSSEEILLKVKQKLSDENIGARRYFYPSLNRLPYLNGESCPVSEDISRRVLCLPLFYEMEAELIKKICDIVNHHS